MLGVVCQLVAAKQEDATQERAVGRIQNRYFGDILGDGKERIARPAHKRLITLGAGRDENGHRSVTIPVLTGKGQMRGSLG